MDIAMDGNHDDLIDFNDNADSKYLFWVNDDNDREEWDPASGMNTEDDYTPDHFDVTGVNQGPNRNCDDDIINCKRDLEDFTLLHLQVDAVTASRPDTTYWIKFENTEGTTPVVNIFQAVDKTSNYVKIPTSAEDQLEKKRLVSVGSIDIQVPNQYIQPGGQVSPFLLEGRSQGKGDLTFIAMRNGGVIASNKVSLELKPIKTFVDTYEVKTHTQGSSLVIEDTADPMGNYSYTPENGGEYVLYVHGWKMPPQTKQRWTETVFKRLWWLGYKGHVGGIFWPSLGLTEYDLSENHAWLSADALKNLIVKLDEEKSPGGVRVVAHSQGNVVTGEALRKLDTAVVHSYIASQAALPAHCYDKDINEYLHIGPWTTPNLYRYFFRDANNKPYFDQNSTKVRNGMYRYFNVKDMALATWVADNALKPDDGWVYRDGDNNKETYYEEIGDEFTTLAKTLKIAENRYEIFSFAAQARSLALGAEPVVNGGFRLSRDLEKWGFDDKHYSHSRQFRSNIVQERPYWTALALDFKLTVLGP